MTGDETPPYRTAQSDDTDRPAPIQTVYTEYWKHARHVTDEVWSFTRIWAVVITAIFTVGGADLPTAAKIGTALFGAVLSVLGFFIVYTLRVPFFDYFLTLEIIAKDEFELPAHYRRLDGDSDARLNKGIDIHDVLVAVYALVAGVLVFSAGVFAGQTAVGAVAGVLVTGGLVVVYLTYVVDQFRATIDDLAPYLED